MIAADECTYRARWIFPVTRPPIADGTISVRGDRITAVDHNGVRTPDIDLGDVAITPGFVNVHTHLDLTGAVNLAPTPDPATFTNWLRSVVEYRRTRTVEQTQQDIAAGIAESIRHGTTLIGDISSGGGSFNLLAASPIQGVVFWEILGGSVKRFDTNLSQFRELESIRPSTASCQWGLSPHAPYSVNHDRALSCLADAPLAAMHLAESPAEMELLKSRSGPMATYLQDLGVWSAETFTAGLKEFVAAFRNIPNARRLYIHGNYLDHDCPFTSHDTLVYCPRTHARFGHSPHPFRHFLDRGVRVCLATDSRASNPDLDALAEARFVREICPDIPGEKLLRMITLSGAEALGFADECGSLDVGKRADMTTIPMPHLSSDEPYAALLDNPERSDAARKRMWSGRWDD